MRKIWEKPLDKMLLMINFNAFFKGLPEHSIIQLCEMALKREKMAK